MRLWLFGCIAACLVVWAPARAHDVPDQVLIHLYAKPQHEHLHVLLRVPLDLLLNLDLPKRGPGYLDLAHMDAALERAVAAVGDEVVLFENGARLGIERQRGRISLLSEAAFDDYERALAHVEGPPLPEGTEVFWNQGFLDVHLVYPIASDRSEFAFETNLAPAIQQRLHVVARYVDPDGSVRAYDLAGDTGRVVFDPRWYQAAATFIRLGILHIFEGIDHLLFLVCLVVPYHGRGLKSLLGVVTAFTVAHSITLVGAGVGLAPPAAWFLPLVEALIAASIVYMAVENVVGANLNRRWLIAAAFGLIHGFGFAAGLRESFQLAGDHLLLSLFAFNVGVELGQVVAVLAILGLRILVFRVLPDVRVGVIIVSAFAAHTAWHWLEERVGALQGVEWPVPHVAWALQLAPWLFALLLAAGIAWQLGQLAQHRPRLRRLYSARMRRTPVSRS